MVMPNDDSKMLWEELPSSKCTIPAFSESIKENNEDHIPMISL
jgi:hypothetical protein